MSPVTHFLAGWMVASMAPNSTTRQRAVIAVAGIVPDLDGLGIVAEVLTRNSAHPLPWFSEYHHVLGHNIGFAAVVTVAAYFICGRSARIAALAFASFHLHILCDLIGARGPDGFQWPIPYLLPFSHALDLTWSGQWKLNAWPNFLITFILLGITFRMAVRRGYSPLEMISAKADTAFVATLQKRFHRG